MVNMRGDDMAADSGLEPQPRGSAVTTGQAPPGSQGPGGSAARIAAPRVHHIDGSALTNSNGGSELADYFAIGMMVELRTLHNKVLEGEVMAFDLITKMLAIKSHSVSGRQGRSDVQIVNLSFVDEIRVTREARNESPLPLPNLNFAQLKSRMNQNIGEKKKQQSYAGVNVSPLAQRLVYAITKTITEVRWRGEDIIVLDLVVISPPYDVGSCRLIDKHINQLQATQALQHVQKLVGKFHKETSSSVSPGSAEFCK